MDAAGLPVFLFIVIAAFAVVGMLVAGAAIGPKRKGRVKEMPYESGMDPIHDTRRRFDVRFHLVAVAFLLFDVEILFLYPWAVASHNPMGVDAAVDQGLIDGRGLVLGGVLFFITLLTLGLVYDWKKGLLRWR